MYPKKCACCNFGEVKELYDTCPICGWVDDPEQNENIELEEGKNSKCLKEYFKEFASNYGMCYCAE